MENIVWFEEKGMRERNTGGGDYFFYTIVARMLMFKHLQRKIKVNWIRET